MRVEKNKKDSCLLGSFLVLGLSLSLSATRDSHFLPFELACREVPAMAANRPREAEVKRKRKRSRRGRKKEGSLSLACSVLRPSLASRTIHSSLRKKRGQNTSRRSASAVSRESFRLSLSSLFSLEVRGRIFMEKKKVCVIVVVTPSHKKSFRRERTPLLFSVPCSSSLSRAYERSSCFA